MNVNDYWCNATTLDGLSAGVVRWLDGELDETPTYAGPPEDETALIRDYLVAINRLGGVLTDSSQPGIGFDPAARQRAYLYGFATFERKDQLVAGLASMPWVSFHLRRPYIWWTGDVVEHDIPVTELEGEAHTWAGRWMSEDHAYDVWSTSVDRKAHVVVWNAWQFCVVDVKWGRVTWLFDRVLEALGVRVEVTS